MSRRGRNVGFNLGPLTIQPKPKRQARRATPPAPVIENGGWPDLATWGVAVMLDPEQVKVLAVEARGQARVAYEATAEPRQTDVAVVLLGEMLHGWCEEKAGIAGLPPLAAHLAQVGLSGIAWDALARRALA